MKRFTFILLIFWASLPLISNGQASYSEPASAGNTGDFAVYIGDKAGQSITSPTTKFNTFVGYESGLNNTIGSANTFIGYKSGWGNTTGKDNTFIGVPSGLKNTTGQGNTFIGRKSGFNNSSGNYNIFSGYESGLFNTTGYKNSFFGNETGRGYKDGIGNTFMGYRAGYSAAAGNNFGKYNTYIGYSAGLNSKGSNNVFIGKNVGQGIYVENKLYIDNSNTSLPLIYGDFASEELIFNGKVGIGTGNFSPAIGGNSTAAYTLFVKGGILAEEVRVHSSWADYVFKEDYRLRPLHEVKNYIATKGHLPNMPSEKEVLETGLNVADITRLQQEKIEELTLYTIKQQNQIDELRKMLQELMKVKTD
jgi:hypothetical protein